MGFAAAFVKMGAGAASVYGQHWAAFQVGNALRQETTTAILRRGRGAGSAADTHAALAVRLREVERGVDEGLFAGFRATVQLLPLAFALVALSSKLAVLALGSLVPFVVALSWARRRLRGRQAKAMRLAEQLHAGVDELVRHLDLWRTYGAGARVQGALGRLEQEAASASARADATGTALSGANEVLAAGALLGAVAGAGRLGLSLHGGPFVAFATVFFLMYRPLRDVGDARTALDRGAEALRALDAIRGEIDSPAPASRPELDRGAPITPPATWPHATLTVERLTVPRSESSRWATTSFEAASGEIVAIVGPTGSGKTTLLRALLGLEPSALGAIRYGERDLMAAGVGPAERPFAWVPQEPPIVSGTVEDNVALGAPEADVDPSAARATLTSLGAGSLLQRAEGVRLLAGGHELSGGERQWVALARALSSGLPVLLLDEPTSGLDPRSQERVLATLAALRGKRTVLLVTHRQEPLAIADRVVRLG